MRILLTGACGLLGSAIRRQGTGTHEFVCMDVAEQVSELPNGVRADYANAEAVLSAAEGCDAIIHTAAMHGAYYGRADLTLGHFITANVIGSDTLFQAALKLGIRRLVLASTMEVLMGKSWSMHGTSSLHETTTPRPDWAYPLTKLYVEQLSDFYSRMHGLETVNLRYMHLLNLSIKDIGLNLLARQFTDTDAANATLLAATVTGLQNELLHIGCDTGLTQQDTNQAMTGDVWGVLERRWPGCSVLLRQQGLKPEPWQFGPAVPVTRAKQLLNWKPESRFDSYLRALGWQG